MTLFTPSFQLIVDYLNKFDYQVEKLDIGAENHSLVSISSLTKNGHIIVSSKAPTYPFATSSARRIFNDKTLSYAFVKSLNLSIPQMITVDRYNSELDAFLDTHNMVIVKPHSGQGGKGLTLNVTNKDQLKDAVNLALEESSQALIQHQFVGEEVRFTTCNGKVAGALLRQKPRVIGDGTSTIAQLIQNENKARELLTFSVVKYPLLDENLIANELLHSQYIPADSEKVELGLGTMIRNGASMYDITDSIDESYIKIVEEIAHRFGNGFIAIDMMIKDINTAATNDNYIFLEMNGDPAIVLYYSCRDGKQLDIVNKYLGPMLVAAIEGASND